MESDGINGCINTVKKYTAKPPWFALSPFEPPLGSTQLVNFASGPSDDLAKFNQTVCGSWHVWHIH